jgi:alpha-tubulin suppressor-like RCC1 family protein
MNSGMQSVTYARILKPLGTFGLAAFLLGSTLSPPALATNSLDDISNVVITNSGSGVVNVTWDHPTNTGNLVGYSVQRRKVSTSNVPIGTWAQVAYVTFPDHGYMSTGESSGKFQYRITLERQRSYAGLLPGQVSLKLGNNHGCILEINSEILCWGDNTHNQLAAASTFGTETPLKIPNLILPTSMSIHGDLTCAVHDGGKLSCWGRPTVIGARTIGGAQPTQVALPVSVKQFALAQQIGTACVISTLNDVWCWGGDFPTTPTMATVQLGSRSHDAVKIASGLTHLSVVNADGGSTGLGYIERGPRDPTKEWIGTSPATLGLVDITAGYFDFCRRNSSGSIECVGQTSRSESLTLSDGTSHYVGKHQSLVRGAFEDAAVGKYLVCLRDIAGTVFCYGLNDKGQRGYADGKQSWPANSQPIPVNGIDNAIAIAAGDGVACALDTSIGIACWGRDLNSGLTRSIVNPQLVPLSTVSSIDFSTNKVCFGSGNIGLTCRGDDGLAFQDDRSGLAPESLSLVEASAGLDAISDSCGISADKTLVCWGSGKNALGFDSGTYPEWRSIQEVTGLVNIRKVSGNCAIDEANDLWCWGEMVGDGTQIFRSATKVIATSNVKDVISRHRSHTCALLMDGQVKCWGANTSGQLGDGSWQTRLTPTSVLGLSDASSFAAIDSYDKVCVVTQSKNVKCWGESSNSPSLVPGLEDVKMATLNVDNSMCIVTTQNRIICRGADITPAVLDNVEIFASHVNFDSLGRTYCGGTSSSIYCWGDNTYGLAGVTPPAALPNRSSHETWLSYLTIPSAVTQPSPTPTPSTSATPAASRIRQVYIYPFGNKPKTNLRKGLSLTFPGKTRNGQPVRITSNSKNCRIIPKGTISIRVTAVKASGSCKLTITARQTSYLLPFSDVRTINLKK